MLTYEVAVVCGSCELATVTALRQAKFRACKIFAVCCASVQVRRIEVLQAGDKQANRDFKLSPWSQCLVLVFGLLSGVLCLLTDDSEHLVGFIFWIVENTQPNAIPIFSSTQKMEPTRCSEMQANKNNAPSNNPKS
jgi:hypothetical protein